MREEKEALVDYATEVFSAHASLFFTTYKGLTVEEFGDFRGRVQEAQGSCRVLKNSVIRLALKNSNTEHNGYQLVGDTVVVFTEGEPSSLAKVIRDFGKDHEAVSFKAVVLDGQLSDAAAAQRLADLPPLEVLQAQLLGVLQAPGRNLLGVLNAKAGSVVHVLQAYANKMQNDS